MTPMKNSAGADAATHSEVIASNDGLCLLRCLHDAFGTQRYKPHYFIVAADDAPPSDANGEAAQGSSAPGILEALDADEVFVIGSNRCMSEMQHLMSRLQVSGYVREPSWPTLPILDMAADRPRAFRMSKPATSTPGSDFERSYAAARLNQATCAEEHHLLGPLQAEIERATGMAVRQTGFDANYGVVNIMHVGSTSRGTYAGFPVDFDIVINTRCERTAIDLNDARQVCDRIIAEVEPTDIFRRFKAAVAARAYWAQTNIEPRVVLSSFGARGPQSLVARYDLTICTESETSHHVGFLDLTFGRLPQLIGYETSVRRLFDRLEPASAERLRSEIRLAKSLLKSIGGVYGTPVRGLRAHAVEQWIIQSLDYRASGHDIGTLCNALCLIVEETRTNDHLSEPASFVSYKTRFPLRHPGWWETEPENSDRRRINLWDLLGDGDATLAADKWRAFLALATTFKNLMDTDSAWDISSIVGAARGD